MPNTSRSSGRKKKKQAMDEQVDPPPPPSDNDDDDDDDDDDESSHQSSRQSSISSRGSRSSARLKRKRELQQQQAEEQIAEAAAAETTTPSRKKRRSSRGSTTPNSSSRKSTAKKRNTAKSTSTTPKEIKVIPENQVLDNFDNNDVAMKTAKDNNDEDEDVEMDDAKWPAEEEVSANKGRQQQESDIDNMVVEAGSAVVPTAASASAAPPAAAGAARAAAAKPAAAASATTANGNHRRHRNQHQKVPAQKRLRLPSQHTPGKPGSAAPPVARPPAAAAAAAATKGKLVLEPAPTPFKKQPPPRQQQQQQDEEPFVLRRPRVDHDEGEPPPAPGGGADGEELMVIWRERVQEWYEQATEFGMTQYDVVREWTTTTIADGWAQLGLFPQQQQEEQDVYIDDDDLVDDTSNKRPLDRTLVWVIIILVFQIVFFPIWFNPILSTTVQFSKVCLRNYQGLLLPSATPPQFDTTIDNKNKDAAAALIIEEQMQQQLLEMQQLQQDLDAAIETQREAMQVLDKKSLVLETLQKRRRQQQNDQEQKWPEIIEALEQLMSMQESLIGHPQVTAVTKLLENSSSSTAETPAANLVDLSRIQLWPVVGDDDKVATTTPEVVSDDEYDEDEEYLQMSDLEEALKTLQAEIQKEAVDAIQDDPESVSELRAWMQKQLLPAVAKAKSAASSSSPSSEPSPSSQQTAAPATAVGTASKQLERVRKMIANRLAIASADGTGQIDHASLLNGAKILRSSPSLVDELPLLNRMAHFWGLRFYGHGPDAALTPTHPRNALGQCWAIQKKKNHKGIGFLTIRLARPVYVESVLVEHPPRQVSDKTNTAVRAFTVFGYEHEDDPEDEPWPLGTFEYNTRSDKSWQLFEVDDEVDDEEVPALRIIKLQMESNWGGPYTCLYRFRVHGESEIPI